MRCKECGEDNDEGVAFCARCNTPFTAYGGQVTGMVSEATLAKAARLALRPPIIPFMAALDVLTAVFGPFAITLARSSARPVANAEGTNYVGVAFGALGAVFTAALLIPLGLVLLVTAWATWTQRTWAWTANAALLALSLVAALLAFSASPAEALVRIALSGAVAYFWFKPETKEWYGA